MIDHVSDLQWDRLLAGELNGAASKAAHDHAAGCARCAARLRELTAGHAAFAWRPAPRWLAPPVRSWRWVGAAVPALAAVVALALLWPGAPGRDLDGTRAKGAGPVLVLAAGAPGGLVPLASGDTLAPGEYVQAAYTAARDGFGAVLSRDGAGAVSVYVPARGATMVALPAGTERSFPQSTVLDDVIGAERIVIVWCEAAHPLAPLLAQLHAPLPVAAPAGCTVRELALDKRAERR